MYKRQVYLSAAQVTRVDTAGSAAIELAGLATYKTTTQPYAYMIVSTNCTTTGWGYLGATIAGDNTKVFSTKTGTTQNWAAVGSGGTCDTFEVRKSDFQITGNISMGAWVKTSDANGVVLGKESSTAALGNYGLDLSSGKARFIHWGGAWYTVSSNTSVNDNNWHFLTAVYTPSTSIKVYVDGALDNSLTTGVISALTDNYGSFMIGVQSDLSNYLGPATIDEPFVTASALTADEIKRMYEVGKRSLTAAGTNALNGTSNQVNAVVAGGLSRFVLPNNQLRITNNKMYAGTAGGGVSEIDLNSDTLVNSFTSSSTPPINSSNVTALTLTSGGNFIAGMDSGMSRVNDVSGRQNVAPTKWLSLAGIFNKDTGYYYLYENGIEVGRTNVGTGHTPITNTASFVVGAIHESPVNIYSYPFYGAIDQTSIYNYPVNTANLNSKTQSPVGVSVIASGARQSKTGAIAWYKFDEGTGTKANNSGSAGNNLNGTLSNTSWNLNGKFGKALQFNGTSSYVNIPNSPNLDTSGNDFTVSAWVNPDLSQSAYIASKTDSGVTLGWYFRINTTGKLFVRSRVGTNLGVDATSNGSSIISNQWTHVSMIHSLLNNTVKFYINGILQPITYALQTFQSTDKLTNPSSLTIGSLSNAGLFYKGLIDEPKIYNYALTIDEVKQEYNRGSALQLGSTSNTSLLTGGSVASNSASAKYCIPGDTSTCAPPVGEWNFENNAKDTSGNGNDGTWSGTGTKRYVPGKVGRAGKFNGSNDYISATNNNSILNLSDFTVSLWFKFIGNGTAGKAYWTLVNNRNSSGNGNNDAYHFMIFSDYTLGTRVGNGTASVNTGGITPVNDNKWHYASLTRSGNSIILYLDGKYNDSKTLTGSVASTDPFYMGVWSNYSNYYNGLIDQVKIYNYARTPAQIAWDYNGGDPIARWKFDECQGSIIHDSSGNKLSGTLNIGPTPAQTAPGNCTDGLATSSWYNGRSGKYNASMNFDGVDDYVDVGNPSNLQITGDLTMSAWIKPTSLTTKFIVGKWGYSGNTKYGYGMFLDTGGISLTTSGNGSSWAGIRNIGSNLSTTTWSHIVGVYKSGTAQNIQLYINGSLVRNGANYGSLPSSLYNTSTSLRIGADSDQASDQPYRFFPGQIDDVQIYNYALNATQIKMLYNQNSAVRFGQ